MDHEFAIHINSDEGLILKKGWEYKAINFMREHENVALAGTLENFQDYKSNDKSNDIFKYFRNKESLRNNDDIRFRYVHGGIYILRKETYNRLGGFNTLVPPKCTNLEYSYYLKTNNWELDEITGWISTNMKILPKINTFLDEYTTAAYPLALNEINHN